MLNKQGSDEEAGWSQVSFFLAHGFALKGLPSPRSVATSRRLAAAWNCSVANAKPGLQRNPMNKKRGANMSGRSCSKTVSVWKSLCMFRSRVLCLETVVQEEGLRIRAKSQVFRDGPPRLLVIPIWGRGIKAGFLVEMEHRTCYILLYSTIFYYTRLHYTKVSYLSEGGSAVQILWAQSLRLKALSQGLLNDLTDETCSLQPWSASQFRPPKKEREDSWECSPGIQVDKQCLLGGIKYIDVTYFW